jgi:hypothetical protein
VLLPIGHARAPHWADFFFKIGSIARYTPSPKRAFGLFVSADRPKLTESDRFEHLNGSVHWRCPYACCTCTKNTILCQRRTYVGAKSYAKISPELRKTTNYTGNVHGVEI